ncbi:hypothetical protein N7281_05215 [Rickettsia hoogstraalii]|uniref:tetratricopeptide repeat protein n=1 Tax=Rickettsia hoogstraalii TaxID=467174 RepID=UPI00224E34E0|nr:hypothetical protein [Rickettsia hoogstraalii]MCX4084237.1 hypothetical protein [Rickettsia hoogstraalii]
MFKQQIEYNKFLSQVCDNQPLDYTFMERAVQQCKTILTNSLEEAIKSIKIEDNHPDIAYYEKAIDYLDLYKNDPNCTKQKANAYKNLGNIYNDQNNYKEAMLNYKKALDSNNELLYIYEKLPTIYENLGKQLFNGKQYIEAIQCFKVIRDSIKVKECFEELIKLNPSDPNIRLAKADYHTSIGEYNTAIKCYNIAFSLSKDTNFKSSIDLKINSLIDQQIKIMQEFVNSRKEGKLYDYDKCNVQEIYQAVGKIKELIHNPLVEPNNLAPIPCNDNHDNEVNINGDVTHHP